MKTQPPPRRRLWRRSGWWLAGVLAAAVLGLLGAEYRGWSFLQQPVERYVGQRLQRDVSFGAGKGGEPDFRLRMLGGIRLELARLQVGNPAWAQTTTMVQAEDLRLQMRWRDLWAARGGAPLRLQALAAQRLDLQLQRRADGSASWDFGTAPAGDTAQTAPAIRGVQIERLQLDAGSLQLRDALQKLDLDGRLRTDAAASGGWVADASGRWRGQALRLDLRTGAGLSQQLLGDRAATVPMVVDLRVGQARLRFDGQVEDPLGRLLAQGSIAVSGPSLAAVGEPFGVTLPTTAAFSLHGRLQHQGSRWQAAVTQARIGRSELAGDFVFEQAGGQKPVLSGELRGSALWLQDLGPAIGAPASGAAAAAATPAAAKTTVAAGAGPRTSPAAAQTATSARVLPSRRFDLPSLSAMQADVRVALDRLELGHERLQAIRPLRAHIKLQDGVLQIDELDARLAQGRISGMLRLDGRTPPARWAVDLSARALQLDEWISQPRPNGQPPYIAGRLAGQVKLQGRGHSAAELLAGSSGQAWAVLTRGRISHLAVELAGLDVAQALGVLLRGDDSLQIACGATDLQIESGLVRPRVLVVDTPDSTVLAEGTVSLVDERLNLVARVEPKDFSPLALRSPLRVRGTLGAPDISVDKRALARRLVPATLLGLLNPLAALLPLLDTGDDDAKAAVDACQGLLARRRSGL